MYGKVRTTQYNFAQNKERAGAANEFPFELVKALEERDNGGGGDGGSELCWVRIFDEVNE